MVLPRRQLRQRICVPEDQGRTISPAEPTERAVNVKHTFVEHHYCHPGPEFAKGERDERDNHLGRETIGTRRRTCRSVPRRRSRYPARTAAHAGAYFGSTG